MLAFYKDTEQAFSPAKGSKYAAGVDLYLPSDISLKPKCKVSIDLHVTVALPGPEYCGLLKLRSGAARRYDISIHEGLVDFDYGGSSGDPGAVPLGQSDRAEGGDQHSAVGAAQDLLRALVGRHSLGLPQ